jgi:hypothetical protein
VGGRAADNVVKRTRLTSKTTLGSASKPRDAPVKPPRGIAAANRLKHDKAYLDGLVLCDPILSVTGEDNPRAELLAGGIEANGTIIKRIHVKTTTKRGAGATFERKLRDMVTRINGGGVTRTMLLDSF